MISAAMLKHVNLSTVEKKGWDGKDNYDMNGIQTSGFFHYGAVVNLVLYQTSKKLLKGKRNRLPTSYALTNPSEKLWVKLKKMFQMSLQPSTSSSPAYQRLPRRSLARRTIIVITYHY